MKEARTMTGVKAKWSAAAGLKCYIAYHWKVYERKIAMIKSLGVERENKDEKGDFIVSLREWIKSMALHYRVLKNNTHVFSSRCQNALERRYYPDL